MSYLKLISKNWQPPTSFQGDFNRKPKLAYAKEKISKTFSGDIEAELSVDKSLKIWIDLNRIKHDYQALYELSGKILKKAPWVIFDTQFSDPPLAANATFLNHYLKVIFKRRIKRAIMNLYTVFLFSYDPKQPYFHACREGLRSLLNNNSSPKLDLIQVQARDYCYFETDGPRRYVKLLSSSNVQIDEFIEGSGLTGFASKKGFVEFVLQLFLEHLGSEIKEHNISSKNLGSYLSYFGQSVDEKFELKHPSLRVILVESLLLPFTKNNDIEDYQDDIQKFTLKYYGDPRMSVENWRNVSEEAKQVMFNWLTKDTLKDFFSLLDYSAKNERMADRHWKYRKAFWNAYLEKGYITEAWVALAWKVQIIASQKLKTSKNSYSGLTGGSANHAVIMLRIGNLLVVDWNYSGSFRIWDDFNDSAPKMFKKHYSKADLMQKPDFEGSHVGSEAGSWQANIAQYLKAKTGATVQRREYMKIQ